MSNWVSSEIESEKIAAVSFGFSVFPGLHWIGIQPEKVEPWDTRSHKRIETSLPLKMKFVILLWHSWCRFTSGKGKSHTQRSYMLRPEAWLTAILMFLIQSVSI